MPWPTYANMTDRDLLAIYTYANELMRAKGGARFLESRPEWRLRHPKAQ
jgi:hypothetical protein